MATDVFQAAISKTSTREFKKILSLKQPKAGMSFNDRIRVADELISIGLIRLQDDLLTVSRFQTNLWISPLLATGDMNAWAITELLLPESSDEDVFDRHLLEEIGLKGELAVISELKTQLDVNFHKRIQHVSLKDDRTGFDIVAPSVLSTSQNRKLEVKTTCRPGKHFNFYISRNEYEVGCRETSWRLVFVELNDGIPNVLGNLTINTLLDRVPIDQGNDITWKSAKVKILKSEIIDSLP